VLHPDHQLAQGGLGRGSKRVSGVPQAVEVDSCQFRGVKSRKPLPTAEVVVSNRRRGETKKARTSAGTTPKDSTSGSHQALDLAE
jgi:hypothetical protein